LNYIVDWNDWLIAHALMNESTVLIDGDDNRLRLRERGDVHARSRRWKDAAADFAAAIAEEPDDHWFWFQSAGLWLMLRDGEAYRRHCGEMLERFEQTKSPVVAERVVKACLLAPNGVPDLARAVRFAERAITGTESDPAYDYFLFARGLAHYRPASSPRRSSV
jgi:hypothetical protein